MYESKEKKEYRRTIRMTPTVQQYVEKQSGNGFNQKFENMVIYCMEKEDILNKNIKAKEKQLEELNKKVSKAWGIINDIERLKNQVQYVINAAENIINENKE